MSADLALTLLQCPFCGGIAEVSLDNDDAALVVCNDCSANSALCASAEGAALAWNTREHTPSEAHELVTQGREVERAALATREPTEDDRSDFLSDLREINRGNLTPESMVLPLWRYVRDCLVGGDK